MAWCTYPRNETLVHQQFSLHQLHHCHPSQRLRKRFSHLHDVIRSIYIRMKLLPRVLNALPYQQFSLHQLHHCHPSQRLRKRFSRLHDVIHSIYIRMKSLPRVLNATRIVHEYNAGEGMPCCLGLINCLAPPLRVKLY